MNFEPDGLALIDSFVFSSSFALLSALCGLASIRIESGLVTKTALPCCETVTGFPCWVLISLPNLEIFIILRTYSSCFLHPGLVSRVVLTLLAVVAGLGGYTNLLLPNIMY